MICAAVLSACETGLGRVAGGDGVLGLERAFQPAGSRTSVTSLWKVDGLMTEFYRNLWQKKVGRHTCGCCASTTQSKKVHLARSGHLPVQNGFE
jgi:hypothetical protein